MGKRLLNLRGLFSNTKFLIAFSVVLSFVFWIVVALEYTPIVNEVIEDVPVKIDISGSTAERLNFRSFGAENLKINIEVEGKRYEVGKLDADDFEVEAETAYVDSAGEKALALKVVPKNKSAEFEIISLSADYVNVFFDEETTKEISVIPDFGELPESKIAAEGYIFDKEEVVVSKVELTGPRTELDKISEGSLEISSVGGLTESKTVEGKLKLLTASGDEVKYVTVNGKSANNYTHSAKIKIFKDEILPVEVEFVNEPEHYKNNHINHTVEPKEIKARVLQNGSGTETSVKVKIDFSDISPDNYVFRFSSDETSNGVTVLDDADIVVRIDVGDIAVETLNFTPDDLRGNNISIQGPGRKDISDEYDLDFDVLSVDVCANERELLFIDENSSFQYVVYIDDTTISPEGGKVPVEIKITESDQGWVSGTYYINVKPK